MQGQDGGAPSGGSGEDAEAFEPRARRLVVDLGLASGDEIRGAEPLSGGVASDIGIVDLGDRKVCVKFALAKLKVAAEWRAPVRRGRAEYAWLAFAGRVVPGAVPRLFGWSEAENGFAMDYVGGAGVALWKARLLAGAQPAGEAEAVGDRLGRIHSASTKPDFDDAPFHNAEDFRALRIEPYLLFTAGRHPELARALVTLASELDAANTVLVHGDVSPKNILLAPTGPILLDGNARPWATPPSMSPSASTISCSRRRMSPTCGRRFSLPPPRSGAAMRRMSISRTPPPWSAVSPRCCRR